MDYEKKYKETLEKARQLCVYPTTKPFISDLQDLFPELKESGDERIRKAIIRVFKAKKDENIEKSFGVYIDDILSWLEKQDEEKSADEVEPKFKVGDWVVSPNGVYWHIDKIYNNRYEVTSNTGESSNWNLDTNIYHKFTIQDAKDGDVLTFYTEYKFTKMVQVGIVEEYVGKHGGCSNTFKIHIGVNWENNLQIGEYMGCSDIRPATKEQCDALMKAMADAGWDFNYEKKELKKIGQKPAEWSENDENAVCVLRNIIKQSEKINSNIYTKPVKEKLFEWLEALKNKYSCKPSEEQRT